MAVKRTPEQEAVVKNRGGGLLVSAAAGSGKTRVLVERLLDYIINEGKNIDEFLIITFTRAAAEELRGRIAKELAEALAAHPDNGHLRRQTALLYETQISTIHAFCTVLLRQWGHLLDVPSDFALCEDEEAQVLMTRTLNQVLEARYEAINPEGDFAQLLDVLSGGRDDSRLMDITLDVYGKIQSYPDPLAWLARQREALDLEGVTDVGETPWGEGLLEEARQTASYWAGQMERACELAQGDGALERAYLDSLQATQRDLTSFAQAAGQGWRPRPFLSPSSRPPEGWRTRRPRSRSRPSAPGAKRRQRSWWPSWPAPAPSCWRTWPWSIRPCRACWIWWRTSPRPMRPKKRGGPCWTFPIWSTWLSACWWTKPASPPIWPASGGAGTPRSW